MRRHANREHDTRTVLGLGRLLPEVSTGVLVGLYAQLRRAGSTLQRLAEAQCNGDWPADNGQLETASACSQCESYWHPSALHTVGRWLDPATGEITRELGVCPDCRTQNRVRLALLEHGLEPVFGGDPRGAVLTVYPLLGNELGIVGEGHAMIGNVDPQMVRDVRAARERGSVHGLVVA